MKNCTREDGFAVKNGKYRTTDITVGRAGQPCCDPTDIPIRIAELVETFNTLSREQDTDVVALVSWLAYAFVMVHPFDDGNGRMSRLLLNWGLLSFGLPFPITLLMGYYKSARKNYFGCIKNSPPVHSCDLVDPPKLVNSLVLESIWSHWCSFFEYIRFCCPVGRIPRSNALPPLGPFETFPGWKKQKFNFNPDEAFQDLEKNLHKLKESNYKLTTAILLVAHSKSSEVPTPQIQNFLKNLLQRKEEAVPTNALGPANRSFHELRNV